MSARRSSSKTGRRGLRRGSAGIMAAALLTAAIGPVQAQDAPPRRDPPAARAAHMIPLYSAFAATQALDIHSTSRALGRGAREGNPLLAPCAPSVACMVAVKAGVSVLAIWIVDRVVRPGHPRAATWLIAGLTGLQAGAAIHNYAVDGRTR